MSAKQLLDNLEESLDAFLDDSEGVTNRHKEVKRILSYECYENGLFLENDQLDSIVLGCDITGIDDLDNAEFQQFLSVYKKTVRAVIRLMLGLSSALHANVFIDIMKSFSFTSD